MFEFMTITKALSDDEAPYAVREAIRWVRGSISKTSKIRQDAKRLKDILKIDQEMLCKAQHGA